MFRIGSSRKRDRLDAFLRGAREQGGRARARGPGEIDERQFDLGIVKKLFEALGGVVATRIEPNRFDPQLRVEPLPNELFGGSSDKGDFRALEAVAKRANLLGNARVVRARELELGALALLFLDFESIDLLNDATKRVGRLELFGNSRDDVSQKVAKERGRGFFAVVFAQFGRRLDDPIPVS